MESTCKVSVIIPVYNAEKYLQECLDSIVCQNIDDYEIICVEDCSTDCSKEIIRAYADKYPMIRMLEYGCNNGQAYARNRGMEVACGKYLYFVDSDDTLVDSNVLQRMYDYAETEQLDVVLFDAYVVYEAKEFEGIYGDEKMTSRFEYPEIYDGQTYFANSYKNRDFSCVVWRQFWSRKFLMNQELFFDEDTSPHEDFLFSFKAVLKAQKVRYVKDAMYTYRCRELSSTTTGFSLKRLKAYILCFAYSMEYFQYYSVLDENYAAMTEYLNDLRKLIRAGAIELIKNGTDVYQLPIGNPIYTLQMRLILTAGYLELTEIINADDYRLISTKPPIVYGVGAVGRDVVRMLGDFGIEDYILAVSKKQSADAKIHGKPIFELAELGAYKENGVIIAVKRTYRDEMALYARNLGFENLVFVS